MVIIQTKSGRLANRLHIFSWFIANSIEHGYALANPTFDEYCRYFPSTRENDFGDLPISVIAPLNLPYKVFFPVTSILKRIKPSGKRYEFVRSEKSPSLNLKTRILSVLPGQRTSMFPVGISEIQRICRNTRIS